MTIPSYTSGTRARKWGGVQCCRYSFLCHKISQCLSKYLSMRDNFFRVFIPISLMRMEKIFHLARHTGVSLYFQLSLGIHSHNKMGGMFVWESQLPRWNAIHDREKLFSKGSLTFVRDSRGRRILGFPIQPKFQSCVAPVGT